MHTEPRNGASIDRIYLHTNEGPEQPGGAAGLAHYLQNNGPEGGGYHVVDGDQLIRIANDDEIVWAEGGDNTHALSLVFEGYANQTPEQWADAFSKGELDRAVLQVAAWCKEYGIPPVKFAPGAPGEAPTGRGIGEHAFDHDPNSQGHTDPGTGFPIDAFIERVAKALEPAPAPSVDWHALEQLAAWGKRVCAHPLELGMRGPDVRILNDLLIKLGYSHMEPGEAYGHNTALGVRDLKEKKQTVNRSGRVFGCAAVHAIFS